jgi:hypothetical protein
MKEIDMRPEQGRRFRQMQAKFMTISFLTWGLSAVSLFVALRSQVPTLVGNIGLVFLLIGAAGPIMAALFPMDPVDPCRFRDSEWLPAQPGVSLSDGIAIAALLLTLSLVRRNPNWKSARRPLIWASVLLWVGIIALRTSMAILLPQHGS